MWGEVLACINVAQDRGKCGTMVDRVMNFRDVWNMDNFWTSLGTVATDDGSLLDGVSYRAVWKEVNI